MADFNETSMNETNTVVRVDEGHPMDIGTVNVATSASLLEILSFATSHYAIGMQLVVICNYFGHVCNYKFGIV